MQLVLPPPVFTTPPHHHTIVTVKKHISTHVRARITSSSPVAYPCCIDTSFPSTTRLLDRPPNTSGLHNHCGGTSAAPCRGGHAGTLAAPRRGGTQAKLILGPARRHLPPPGGVCAVSHSQGFVTVYAFFPRLNRCQLPASSSAG